MPITRSPMPEGEQWSTACQLIEALGEEVGDYLMARIRSLMDAHDHVGAKTWLDICDKVHRLWCSCGTVH